MSREWKPGDVGVNVEHGYRSIYVESCRIAEHGRGGGACWHNESGMADPPTSQRSPLVVIDPDDREQVEMLRDLWDGAHTEQQGYPPSQSAKGARGNALQAALREFADPKPPKPAEPTGLGAVVVDRDGSALVRVDGESTHPWRATGGHRFSWDDVDYLTTLSEGAEPMADWEIDLLRGAR